MSEHDVAVAVDRAAAALWVATGEGQSTATAIKEMEIAGLKKEYCNYAVAVIRTLLPDGGFH